MPRSKKIVITGTHLTPALEFIRQLQNDPDTNWEIYYIGRIHNSSTNSTPAIESKLISKIKIKYFGIDCGKFDRRWFLNTLNGIPQTFSALFKAYKILGQIKPSLVLSFGGYLSVPVLLAAAIRDIPSVTHEQTFTLSLSTRLNSLFSKYVALSFPIKTTSPKYIVTGNLLRQEIFSLKSPKFTKLKNEKPIIYVTGGNQGSLSINNLLKKSLPLLTKNYFVIHQYGQKSQPKTSPNYLPLAYINSQNIGWVLNRASLIISRAGANTCQEIVALKIKSILIPLLISQQDEQLKNADYVKSLQPDITIIIPEKKLNPQILQESIAKLSIINSPKSFPAAQENLKLLKLIKTI